MSPVTNRGQRQEKDRRKQIRAGPAKKFLRPARNPSLPSFFYAEGNSPNLKKDNEKENE